MAANEPHRVAQYFDTHTQRYDELYGEAHPLSQRLVDRLFHKVIKERFDLTFARAGDLRGRRVLDVGCGSGRYAVRFAVGGAAEVVGVDVSEKMLDLARARARAAGVEDRCTFLRAEFLEWPTPGPFDVITAIGFFDYVGNPERYVAKIASVLRGDAFATFPIRWQVRAFIRRLSFLPSGCPVNFYTRSEVDRLWRDRGFASVELVMLDRDYFVHARSVARGAGHP